MQGIRKLTTALAAIVPTAAILGSTLIGGAPLASAATYTNLVQNGTFGTNTWPWVTGPNTMAIAQDSHAYVYNTANLAFAESVATMSQCVEMEANSLPTFEGSVFIPAGQVRTGSARYYLRYYKNADCTNFKGSTELPVVTQTNTWKSFSHKLDAWTAKDAQSVLIEMRVVKETSKAIHRDEDFLALFDVVRLIAEVPPAPPVPPAPLAPTDDEPGDVPPPAVDEPADLPVPPLDGGAELPPPPAPQPPVEQPKQPIVRPTVTPPSDGDKPTGQPASDDAPQAPANPVSNPVPIPGVPATGDNEAPATDNHDVVVVNPVSVADNSDISPAEFDDSNDDTLAPASPIEETRAPAHAREGASDESDGHDPAGRQTNESTGGAGLINPAAAAALAAIGFGILFLALYRRRRARQA